MTIVRMIVMRVAMLVETKIDMVMEKKENGDIKMMIDTTETGTHMVEREIGVVCILMNIMAEMVLEMMILEEVMVMMIIKMVQETEASMMMTGIQLGKALVPT